MSQPKFLAWLAPVLAPLIRWTVRLVRFARGH